MKSSEAMRFVNGRSLSVCGAILALGVAIAVAQNDKEKPDARPAGERKSSPAESGAVREGKGEAAAPARKRGHGLGFDVESQGEQGLRVSKVDEKGIAAQAGLRVNDKIISVGGRQFTRVRPLQAFLSGHGGEQYPILIERNGQQYTVQFTPGQLQDDSAWLGVYLEEGDANMKGARITQVYPAGPAARSGLWAGDIITRVGDEKIEDSADLVATVQNLEPQKQIDFAVLRGEQEVKVPVLLGRRDSFVYRDFDESQQEGQGQPRQQNSQYRGDAFEDVPPYAMQLEHDRRNAEQHERIENEIRLLREEIAKLREELHKK